MVVRIVFWTVLDYRLVVVSVLLYGLSPDPGFFTVLGTGVRPTTAAIMMAGRIHVQSGEMFSGTARPATTGLTIIRPISEPATTAAR